MADLNRPRGTRDFNPEQMELRRNVERKIRGAIERFGYREIQTPAFENLELFVAKSGEQVVDQIYSFRDKGGRDIALRPELTAPAMRFYASDLRNEPKPLRLYYFGNCFRYERPQKGRYREFWQIGLEYIGRRTPLANAEVIQAAMSSLEETGLEGLTLRVGHVGLLIDLLKSISLDPRKDKDLSVAVDKKDMSALREIFEKRADRSGIDLMETITKTYDEGDWREALSGFAKTSPSSVEELLEVLDLLQGDRKAEILCDLSILRGLDYYDGVVFEVDAPSLGAEKQVCGGGSYSLGSILGPKVEAIGFALGFDRIMVALGDLKVKTHERPRFLLIPMGDRAKRFALGVQDRVHRAGHVCFLETFERPLKKAIGGALTSGCTHIIIIGDEEVDEGVVSIKELETKTQTKVNIGDMETYLEVYADG